MSLDVERLYGLVPSVYRVRDSEHGQPLRALLGLFANELQALEESLEQLYDDQFIETCDDWAAPYIGDLIGYRPLHGASPAVASPRAEVANTIAYRRRKGTALMLEQLARDVTSWPAHAAEFFEQLATTQYMNHLRPHAPATAAVRSEAAMQAASDARGAFNRVAHTAEMRHPETASGRFNIPHVGLFLWRLQSIALDAVPLTPDTPPDPADRRWRLNPLGADLRLYRKPRRESSISELSGPAHVPAPLDLRSMARALRQAQSQPDPDADRDDDLGAGESVHLERFVAGAWVTVPAAELLIADLRDAGGGLWAHEDDVPPGRIALDPERGRVLRSDDVAVPLRASWHYGSAHTIGGGSYERADAPAGARVASAAEALQPHLDALRPTGGVLAIADSLTYAQTPALRVDAALELSIVAANGQRPLVAAGADVVLEIGARGRLVLDGLVISGGALTLAAAADTAVRELVLRHCTLVPGRRLNADGSAALPGSPSLVVAHRFARVRLEHCIVGALRVAEGAEVVLDDCIVDAGAASAVAFEGIAAAPGDTPAGGELTIVECSVIGKLHTERLRMASNSLLVARRVAGDGWRGPVWAERTQEGCVRFCWLPLDSVAPRRHRCLPDAARPRLAPQFTSTRYGDAAYLQLRRATPEAIRSGAGPRWRPADAPPDDAAFGPGEGEGGEIGVMNALAQPQREINLRVRLDEYLRVGLRAGVFYAT